MSRQTYRMPSAEGADGDVRVGLARPLLSPAHMSLLARLAELRARRAARALLEIQQGIDRCVLEPGSTDDSQVERLCILRELAIAQIEHLSRRLRRDRAFREALEATCRAYHAWAEQEPGTPAEPRCADALAVRILELHAAVEQAEAAEQQELPAAPVVIASLRR